MFLIQASSILTNGQTIGQTIGQLVSCPEPGSSYDLVNFSNLKSSNKGLVRSNLKSSNKGLVRFCVPHKSSSRRYLSPAMSVDFIVKQGMLIGDRPSDSGHAQ